jgi:hypothetical protein
MFHVLFFLDLASRTVKIAGATTNPNTAGAGPSRGTDGEYNVRARRCVRCRTSETLPLCLYCRRVALSQLPPQGCSPCLG